MRVELGTELGLGLGSGLGLGLGLGLGAQQCGDRKGLAAVWAQCAVGMLRRG